MLGEARAVGANGRQCDRVAAANDIVTVRPARRADDPNNARPPATTPSSVTTGDAAANSAGVAAGHLASGLAIAASYATGGRSAAAGDATSGCSVAASYVAGSDARAAAGQLVRDSLPADAATAAGPGNAECDDPAATAATTNDNSQWRRWPTIRHRAASETAAVVGSAERCSSYSSGQTSSTAIAAVTNGGHSD